MAVPDTEELRGFVSVGAGRDEVVGGGGVTGCC